MALRIKRYLTSVNASNCYLCWCPRTKRAAIVDPAELTEQMREDIDQLGLSVEAILITHGHYDHDNAADEAVRLYGARLFAAIPKAGGEKVTEGLIITLGDEKLRVEQVPGHTADSVAFIGETVAFVGDALFAAAVGGTAGRDGFEQETSNVRDRILSLSPATTLYPGHGPATTVALERCFNPFFVGAFNKM